MFYYMIWKINNKNYIFDNKYSSEQIAMDLLQILYGFKHQIINNGKYLFFTSYLSVDGKPFSISADIINNDCFLIMNGIYEKISYCELENEICNQIYDYFNKNENDQKFLFMKETILLEIDNLKKIPFRLFSNM